MATVLGRRVWQNAGSPEVDLKRLMVSIGTGMGSTEEMLFAYDGMRERGLRAVSPLVVQMYMPNGAAAAVGLELKAKAGVITPVSACASGSEGIAQAWRKIVLGEADIAVCGGSRRRSRRCRSPASPRCASCCPRPTTIPPAPAGRSTGTATDSCSARAVR
jgi:beta-ketoacyl ACP synthase